MGRITLWKSADADVEAGTCSKCSKSLETGWKFCDACGAAVKPPDASAPTIHETAPDLQHLKRRTFERSPEDDIEGRIEKMLSSGAAPDEIDAAFANKAFGSQHDAARTVATRAWEAHSSRVKGTANIRKASAAAEALRVMADTVAKDLKVDHEAAYAFIRKNSAAGRELIQKALAESRASAITV
jgi:hypothetical protein